MFLVVPYGGTQRVQENQTYGVSLCGLLGGVVLWDFGNLSEDSLQSRGALPAEGTVAVAVCAGWAAQESVLRLQALSATGNVLSWCELQAPIHSPSGNCPCCFTLL
ncbi:hypothetical protein Nmel_017670 [Mimus melanotis]